MRIIAGKHGGRVIMSPLGKGVRPTSSRTREAIFNILHSMNVVEGSIVLDICCGTGALGIEALSRGAKKATFIDGSNEHLQLTWKNICLVGEQTNSTLIRAFAEDLPIAREQFNLVFIDPPYFKGIAGKALKCLLDKNWLFEKAIIVVELAKQEDLNFTEPYQEIMSRYYGNSKVILLNR